MTVDIKPARWRTALFLLLVSPFLLWGVACLVASRVLDWWERK